MERARRYCFTINNWNNDDLENIKEICTDAQYILGNEKGKKKETPHLQGYIEFKNAKTFSAIKKLIPRAHIEKAKGNKQQNIDYCSKENILINTFENKSEKLNKIIKEENIKDRVRHLMIHKQYEKLNNVQKKYIKENRNLFNEDDDKILDIYIEMYDCKWCNED